MGPFDDLVPPQNRPSPAGIVGPPRQPAPQTATDAALAAENLAHQRLVNRQLSDQLGPEIGAATSNLTGPDFLETLPPADARMVRAISEGRIQIPNGRALTSGRWQRWILQAQQYDPTLDVANARTRYTTRREYTSGVASRNIQRLNTALGHLNSLAESAEALDNFGGLGTFLNAPVNQVRDWTGDPRITRFLFDRQAVADELEATFRGSGGTLEGTRGWRERISAAQSPEQLRASIDEAAELLNSRLQAVAESYDRGMGRADAHMDWLDPHAAETMARFGHTEWLPNAPNAAAQPQARTDRTAQTISGFDADNQALSTGDVQADPSRAMISEQIRRRLSSMLKQGATDDQIRNYGMSVGVSRDSMDAAINFRRSPQWREWRRQRPNEAYPFRDETRNVPMGAVEGTVAGAAGSGPGTAFINAGNAIIPSALIASATGGDAERTRLGIEAGRRAHPAAALAGTITGAAGTLLGGARVAGSIAANTASSFPRLSALLRAPVAPAQAGFSAGRPLSAYTAFTPRAVVGDAAYGAVQGAGENDDPLSGALEYVVGGALGRGALRTLGRTVSPSGGRVPDLYGIGVRPSPGQRFGGIVNSVEQRMQDVPLVGDAIRGTRQRARDQFQTGVFNDALDQVGSRLPQGARGPQAHAFSQREMDRAYDTARRSMVVNLDQQTTADLAALQQTAAALRPESQRQFSTIWEGVVARRLRSGSMNGDAYKRVQSELGRRERAIRANQTGDSELADAIAAGRGIIDGAARRHSPPQAVAALDAADAAYARMVQIQNASRRRGGGFAEFTPTQYDAAVQQGSAGIRDNRYLAGKALNSRFAAQGRLLEDTIPDSGTPQRIGQIMGVNALAGGGAYAEPTVALPLLAGIGAAYAPGVRNVTTGALAPRKSPLFRNVGDLIREQSGRGSLFGPVAGYITPREYSRDR